MALPPKEELFYPLFTEIYSQEPEKYGLHLPIMMLDFEVNQFSDDAISNGNIVFNDGVFSEGSNAQEGVLTKEFFAFQLLLTRYSLMTFGCDLIPSFF
ncbi:MAG: hypothetical protein IPG07_17250 [Crocinitomicaceae bacterium]|nr:hypothetical protein [Crocinitomicaceae bacterium]